MNEDAGLDGFMEGHLNGNAELVEMQMPAEPTEPPCPVCRDEACNGECDHGPDSEGDESMDGDHASALASAGFGTDEDYGGGTHLEDQHLDGMGEE